MTLNRFCFRALLALILVAPLPLGANRPLAWSLLALATGLLVALWSIGRLRPMPADRPAATLRPLWPVAVPFLLVLAWMIVQALPIVPASWSHPLWREAAGVLPPPVSGRISLDPALTWDAVMKLVLYGAVFWLSAHLGTERVRAYQALSALAWAGFAYGCYGLIMFFGGWERLLWLPKWAYLGDLTATFVNRNAYGAYAGVGILVATGLFFTHLNPPRNGGLRHRAEKVVLGALPYGFATIVLATAMLLSHSRGALLSTGLALVILLITLTLGRVIRPRLFLLALFCLAIGGGALVVTTGEVTLERLINQTELEGDRGQLARLGSEMVTDAPLTGFGAGAFTPAFRLYRDVTLPRPVIYDYAHDIYLDAAIELGLPATVLLALALLIILSLCAVGLRVRRRDQLYPALALATAALFLTHGLVDFSVEMPANAMTFALLLGLGFAQSRSSRHQRRSDDENRATCV